MRPDDLNLQSYQLADELLGAQTGGLALQSDPGFFHVLDVLTAKSFGYGPLVWEKLIERTDARMRSLGDCTHRCLLIADLRNHRRCRPQKPFHAALPPLLLGYSPRLGG